LSEAIKKTTNSFSGPGIRSDFAANEAWNLDVTDLDAQPLVSYPRGKEPRIDTIPFAHFPTLAELLRRYWLTQFAKSSAILVEPAIPSNTRPENTNIVFCYRSDDS